MRKAMERVQLVDQVRTAGDSVDAQHTSAKSSRRKSWYQYVLMILIPVSYSYWYYTEYDTLGKILLQYYTDPVRAAEYHTE